MTTLNGRALNVDSDQFVLKGQLTVIKIRRRSASITWSTMTCAADSYKRNWNGSLDSVATTM